MSTPSLQSTEQAIQMKKFDTRIDKCTDRKTRIHKEIQGLGLANLSAKGSGGSRGSSGGSL